MSKRKTGEGTLIKFRGGGFTFATGPAEGGGFTYNGGSCGSYYAAKATYEEALDYIRQLHTKISQLEFAHDKLILDVQRALGVEEETNG